MGLFDSWRRDTPPTVVCVRERRHGGPCELLPMPRPAGGVRVPDRETLVARSVTVSAIELALQRGLSSVFEPWSTGESARRTAARHFAFLRWLVGEHRLSDWSL